MICDAKASSVVPPRDVVSRKNIAYGRDRLRPNRIRRTRGEFVHVLVADDRAPGGVVGIIVVELIPMVRIAIAVVEWRIWQSVQVTHDRLHARLHVIGAVRESDTCA